MSHRAVALEFIQTFAAGDVASLERLLADDLQFTGPYLTATSKTEYLAILKSDPPVSAEVRILSVTEDGDDVAVFYEYEKPDETLTIAQLFRFRGSEIAETRLVFDS